MSSIRIKVTCSICGTERSVTLGQLIDKSWLECPTCGDEKKAKKTD